jgi:hypothetical protein
VMLCATVNVLPSSDSFQVPVWGLNPPTSLKPPPALKAMEILEASLGSGEALYQEPSLF